MTLRTDPDTLQQILRPGRHVRNDSECRIDITPDTIRLRALSEDHEAFLDHSLPTAASGLTVDDMTDGYWTALDRIHRIVTAGTGTDITLITPAETADGRLVLHSDDLTYQSAPLDSQTAHRIFDTLEPKPTTELTLSHKDFAHAVSVANLVGNSMHVRLNPDTHHVEFTAHNTVTGDNFSYSVSAKHIDSKPNSPTGLTISIERLKDIISGIPPGTPLSIQLTPDSLVYQAEFPFPGAELSLYIAEQRGTIHP